MTDTEKFRFCVAPMLDWTDRHCRYFMRLMTKRARLYTEMVTAPAILFGNRDLLLKFDETEHPVACQLGGSDPEDLAKAAAIAAQLRLSLRTCSERLVRCLLDARTQACGGVLSSDSRSERT